MRDVHRLMDWTVPSFIQLYTTYLMLFITQSSGMERDFKPLGKFENRVLAYRFINNFKYLFHSDYILTPLIYFYITL